VLFKVRQFVPEEVKGWIDFYRFPDRRFSYGGPFNGQTGRRAIFEAIMTIVAPSLILETGTHLGTTTELMAGTGIPIVTVESNARNYGFSRARLRRFQNVELRLGDSRIEARHVLFDRRNSLGRQALFAYLDAHWNEDLPLAEEIDIIFSQSSHAVVMIDDFEVPDDPGFGYDGYGPGKTLNAGYIAALVEAHDLAIFYPSAPSSEETGHRRGCVVLCKAAILGSKLQAVSLLRRAKPASRTS
jgi:hypothetical protein